MYILDLVHDVKSSKSVELVYYEDEVGFFYAVNVPMTQYSKDHDTAECAIIWNSKGKIEFFKSPTILLPYKHFFTLSILSKR